MKHTGMALIVLTALSLTAAEVDPKMARLIGPDSWLVAGHDLERYRGFQLSKLLPLPVDRMRNHAGIHEDAQIRQLMVVMGGEEGDRLVVFRGAVWPRDADARFVPLDDETGIMGLTKRSEAEGAISRWQASEEADGEVVDTVRDLGATYDSWLIAERPLEHLEGDGPHGADLQYRKQLLGLIEEVRAGIRLGPYHEVNIEVTAPSSEDAASVAALARLLPGLLQMNSRGPQKDLVNLVEGLEIRTVGNTVTVTFSVAEHKVEALLEKLRTVQTEQH